MAKDRRSPMLIALNVGGLAGALLMLTAQRLATSAEAHLDPWGHTLPYSYRDPNCTIPAGRVKIYV